MAKKKIIHVDGDWNINGDYIGGRQVNITNHFHPAGGANEPAPSPGAQPDDRALAEALLDCPSLQDAAARDAVVGQLPADMRNAIRRSGTPKVDVLNIAATCRNYAGGVQALAAALHFFEGDSLPMRRVMDLAGWQPRREGAGGGGRRGESSAQGVELPGSIRRRLALLVGVNQYEDAHIQPLKYCANDAARLGARLQALGYEVRILQDGAGEESLPQRNNVLEALQRACARAEGGDLLWVHFACHGKTVRGAPTLALRDSRVSLLEHSGLPVSLVEGLLRESRAARKLLTLDACESGVEVGRDLPDPDYLRKVYDLAQGFALLAASTARQSAQEDDGLQMGVFTHHLLQALQPDACPPGRDFITVGDLVERTLYGLRKWADEHPGMQEPTARTEGIHAAGMIVADFRGKLPA